MANTTSWLRGRAWLTLLALITIPWLAGTALAQDDPPGRIARLAASQGAVSWFDNEQGQWVEAQHNRPLTSGDRLSTGGGATAEVRVGSTVLRLAEATEIELMRIDDERIALQLHRGSLALQVRSREAADEIDLVTAEVMLRPLRSGLYRLDRFDDLTHATTLRGALRVDEREGFAIEAGQRVELWREGAGVLRSRYGSPPEDAFAAWIADQDRREERSAASRYVSPEMTGAEELDRNGRWEQHPEYGAVWTPVAVAADWAPYRYGRWAWVSPWGWTWVDDASWGFAPFHYGRWVHWRGRWGWSPGPYVARPVYAPALVAWIGGPRAGVSIQVGGPAVSWVPLAPREPFRPYYHATPRHEDRVNHRPPSVDRPGRPEPRPQQQQPGAPVTYVNASAPGAVTSVPRDVLVQRRPVGRAAIDNRDMLRSGMAMEHVGPPPRAFVAPQPGQPQPAPSQREPRWRPWIVQQQPAPAATPTRPAPTAPTAPFAPPSVPGAQVAPAAAQHSVRPAQQPGRPFPHAERPGPHPAAAPAQAATQRPAPPPPPPASPPPTASPPPPAPAPPPPAPARAAPPPAPQQAAPAAQNERRGGRDDNSRRTESQH